MTFLEKIRALMIQNHSFISCVEKYYNLGVLFVTILCVFLFAHITNRAKVKAALQRLFCIFWAFYLAWLQHL